MKARCILERLVETQVGMTLPGKGKKSNSKTGAIPVSTTSARTCPPSCPLSKGGCYAAGGPLAIHWKKVTSNERGMAWEKFCAIVADLPEGQLWRHNQAGDLPGEGEAIDAEELKALVEANRGKRGFTYSHKYNSPKNLELIRYANDNGFTINLSANNLAQADELAALDAGPIAVVLPEDQITNCTTPEGRRVVICPEVTRGLTCEQCALCQKQRSVIVGLPAHGSTKKKASTIAHQGEVTPAAEPVARQKLDTILNKISQKAF